MIQNFDIYNVFLVRRNLVLADVFTRSEFFYTTLVSYGMDVTENNYGVTDTNIIRRGFTEGNREVADMENITIQTSEKSVLTNLKSSNLKCLTDGQITILPY